MATGRLATSTPSATTWTTVYTVPTAKVGTININVCNRNASSATFRIALSTATTPSDGEHIAYDYPIAAAGVAGSSVQFTGHVLAAAQLVTVYASTTGLDFVVDGYEA